MEDNKNSNNPNIDQVKDIDAKTRANKSLEFYWKILIFLAPAFLPLILRDSFEAMGYKRKSRQMTNCAIYGLFFYILLMLLSEFL